MMKIIELREHAERMEPEIEELEKSMKQFLEENVNSKIINVRIFFDGSLNLYSDVPIERSILQKFLKIYGLYQKGHFIPNEGAFHNHYELKYWD